MDERTGGQVINALQPGEFSRLAKVIPSGSLETRKLASSGIMLAHLSWAKAAQQTSCALRSYLRAAYQTAKAARSKASIPLRFKRYRITSKPAADTKPDKSATKAAKHPLTLKR